MWKNVSLSCNWTQFDLVAETAFQCLLLSWTWLKVYTRKAKRVRESRVMVAKGSGVLLLTCWAALRWDEGLLQDFICAVVVSTILLGVNSSLSSAKQSSISVAARSVAWVYEPFACWDCGFESRRGLGCLFLVIVVWCQVEVSATGRSHVQRSSCVCVLSVIEELHTEGLDPLGLSCHKRGWGANKCPYVCDVVSFI